jgi:hypothetical protein
VNFRTEPLSSSSDKNRFGRIRAPNDNYRGGEMDNIMQIDADVGFVG